MSILKFCKVPSDEVVENNNSAKYIGNTKSKQTSLFGNQKRLWIYGVLTYHLSKKGWMVAKAPGQHIAYTREQAIKYAQNETFGKGRGMVQKDNVIFCVDMTEQAKKVGMFYEGSKFDDYIRGNFPNWGGIITNDGGGSSRELLEFDASNLDENDIKIKLLDAIKKVSNQDLLKPSKVYTARPYISTLLRDGYDSNKLLLAGCPGSGKETSTLTLYIKHHDRLWDSFKLNLNSLHVAVATIPSTTMELIKELSDVTGMWNNGVYYDYSRIKPYVLKSFANSYEAILNNPQKMWFKQNVAIVDSVENIPQNHSKDIVPILMGSFQDIGMADSKGNITKLKVKYKGLEDRLGILSVGEAHKFLSNPNNKMWANIDSLKREFLMLITGTPYDYIFNEESQLYFTPEERGIFTWIDLMREKLINPSGPFGNYPDVNYYGLPNLKDIILELKQNDLWEDDMNSFTYKKLFTTMTEDGEFKYKDAIIYLFRRLFVTEIDPFTNQSNGLSINSAPQLCDTAKRHMIIALPSGQDGVGVGEYVPLLTKLLNNSGILSEYKLLEVYENGDVSDVLRAIENDSQKTITFTCTKYLTGTNIPAWGSVIFLKSIGNSIKLFEQIIGRVKRPFGNKPNCGIFVGNIDEVMSIEVSITEKLSMLEGKSTPFKEIVTEVLKCYNIFTSNNGSWEKLDFPDLVSRLEELSVKGNYGVSSCIRELKTPKNFDEIYKTIGSGKEDITIIDNGGIKAKDLKKTVRSKQLELFADEFKKSKDKDVYYRNMVKKHLAKMQLLCYTEELHTIQDAVKLIQTALENPTLIENKIILDQIGKGVDWIPYYMLDPKQIDILYTNKWIHKINSDNISLESLLELLAKPELQEENTAYYPTPLWLFDEMINKLTDIEKIQNPTILDPAAGRGTSLISFIKIYQKLGLKIDSSNIYYCDIDPIKVKVFRKLNKEYNLGIPEENIFCEDVLSPSPKFKTLLDMKEFDVVIGNWPYEKKVGPKKTQAIWDEFTELFLTKVKTKYLMPIHPSGWRNINGNFKYIQKMIFEKNLKYLEIHNEKDGLDTFGKETRYDWFILENTPNNSKTQIKFQNGDVEEIDVSKLNFIPNSNLDKIHSLIAKNGEESVNVLYSSSDYEIRYKHMNKEKTEEFKYPCVYTVNSQSEPSFYYSNTNQNGHFGIPKFIWSNGRISSIGSYIDETGEYGLTQFSYAIVDEPENLPLIKKAFDSVEFRNLMESCAVTQLSVNYKIISLFKKDFWKEFIDD
jgi:hypothetical protein